MSLRWYLRSDRLLVSLGRLYQMANIRLVEFHYREHVF
ncbi:hypothetical protein AO383_1316 [Moraxella catarrhalis]|nr:hypothetical protein AO383_1316 [Moraxella catarrhalis]